MPLTILNVAFPFAPVGPHAVGGAEHILNRLDQEIVASGNISLVAACEGSKPEGKLFPIKVPQGDGIDTAARLSASDGVQAAIDRALATNCVDLIHIHAMDFYQYRIPSKVPVLVTLHLPFAWHPIEIWDKLPSNVQVCCVSESQRRSGPASLRDAPVIENGVSIPEDQHHHEKAEFALVLGRICPEKNAHEALIAGSLARVRVLLAGRVFPFCEHIEYFQAKIEPLLRESSVRHEFVGPVESSQKEILLSRAKCLLHPTRAPETSSLVAMEAMARGTPVIAYRSGALNEIVEDKITGFLVNSPEEMAEALRDAGQISSEDCRRSARRRFDCRRMVAQYFEMYDSLLCKARGKRCYV